MNTTLKDKWSMNVPPEGKASQNKRRKRESLLNNAFELFTQKGITDTTISDIVEKAGVAKGTFYLYFKDKYDLRDRLVRHKAELILDMKKRLAEITAERTGKSLETILKDNDRDNWFNAQEGLEYGFFDHIATTAGKLPESKNA